MQLLVVLVALLALACGLDYEVELLNEQQLANLMLNETLSPESKGLILNSQAKKALKNTLKQMPCGWPEYNIPPLAPYTNPDIKVHFNKSVADAFVQLLRFRFDGLDQMQVKKLKVSFTFNKKVKFHFTFKELKGNVSLHKTDAFLDLKKFGLDVRFEGSGPAEFSLNNVSIKGQFKYKAPLIFGSLKIYKFEAVVTVDSVTSNIGGVLGNGKLNALVNHQIEHIIPKYINGHQTEISGLLEDSFVPRVNAMMKGKKIWSIFGLLGSSKHKCDPTPAPWLRENFKNL